SLNNNVNSSFDEEYRIIYNNLLISNRELLIHCLQMLNDENLNSQFFLLEYTENVPSKEIKNFSKTISKNDGVEISELVMKLTNYNNRYNRTYKLTELASKILNEPILHDWFSKTPTKQNPGETAFLNFAEKNNVEIKKLSNSEYRIFEGKLVFEKSMKDNKKSASDVDFYWKNVWITQKFISGDGGAQNNQIKDLQKWIANVVACLEEGNAVYNEEELLFLVVIDGSNRSMRSVLSASIPP